MRLVSTTLAGPGTESLIIEALRSVVEWVDICLVIQTSLDTNPLDAARLVAGDKLKVARFGWLDDFAAARNAALVSAARLGDWAITVDTDERIELHGEDIRSELASTDDDVVYMRERGGAYSKDRAFRLPAIHRWSGAIHEFFPQRVGGHKELSKARFWEAERTPEALRAKLERDSRALARLVDENPCEGRWWYYLGDARASLGEWKEAIECFERASEVSRWDEERAWSCYRAAVIYCELDQYHQAVEACASGLKYHGSIAELYWLAGFAASRLGRFEHAIGYCHSAIALGLFRGIGARFRRIGFSYRRGLWEGPYDVLRAICRAVGDNKGEAIYDRLCIEAEQARHEAE